MNKETAGYSGKPLAQKLGLKPGIRVKSRNAPNCYLELLGAIPERAIVSPRLKPPVDMYHAFVLTRVELEKSVRQGLKEIHQAGMIWISWPKKSSHIPSDVTEDTVREVALPLGLVDVKVCAVDDNWSGLKLVIRKENRK
jgi:hypothetical protein